MTFSPDKSPRGNIFRERERERREPRFTIDLPPPRPKKENSKKRRALNRSFSRSTMSRQCFERKTDPRQLSSSFRRHSVRNSRQIFRSERIVRLEKLWDGENGWKKHFAAMKENRKAIYFLWELRRIQGSIASKVFVTVTYFQRNEGGGFVSPGDHFSRQRNIFNGYPCIFQCASIDKLIWRLRVVAWYLVSTAEKYSCFVTWAISRCSLVEGNGGGTAQREGQR